MNKLVPLVDLQPGDIILYGKDETPLEVKAVQHLGAGLVIVDFTDDTATAPLFSHDGATVINRA